MCNKKSKRQLIASARVERADQRIGWTDYCYRKHAEYQEIISSIEGRPCSSIIVLQLGVQDETRVKERVHNGFDQAENMMIESILSAT